MAETKIKPVKLDESTHKLLKTLAVQKGVSMCEMIRLMLINEQTIYAEYQHNDKGVIQCKDM